MTDEQWLAANVRRVETMLNRRHNNSSGCACPPKQIESIRTLLIKDTMDRYKFDRDRAERLVDQLLNMLTSGR